MNNKKGYTLVELIITLAVVSIMIVPIFNAFLESNRVNLIAKRQISGAYVAQNTIEDLKIKSQSELDTLANMFLSDPDDSTLKFTKDSGNTTFSVSIDISKQSALLTTLDSRSVTQDPIPTSDIVINIPMSGSSGSISFNDATTPTLAFDSDVVNFISTLDTYLGLQMSFNMLGDTSYFTPLLAGEVSVKVVGPSDTPWSINWLNLIQTHVLKVYPADNDLSNIRSSLDPVSVSLSDVIIHNSRPLVVGDVNQAKEWYQVTVRVEHNGIVYETLDSTIGK